MSLGDRGDKKGFAQVIACLFLCVPFSGKNLQLCIPVHQFIFQLYPFCYSVITPINVIHLLDC